MNKFRQFKGGWIRSGCLRVGGLFTSMQIGDRAPSCMLGDKKRVGLTVAKNKFREAGPLLAPVVMTGLYTSSTHNVA